MSIVTWSFPTKIVFGPGALAMLGDQVRAAGGQRALVVADGGVVKAGITERVRKVLEGAGIATMVFDRVDPDSSCRTQAADSLRPFAADTMC